MKNLLLAGAALLLASISVISTADSLTPSPPGPKPGDILEGDAGAACNMLMCLSDLAQAKLLPECGPPLQQYNDMSPHKRPGFLAKCPKDKD